ncbi:MULTISPECIES: HPr family phosphocarrier protein [unclassified Microbacterium]|uniref:HPr family phosphocarrier protein n=1 Tax=unclassified Microbacterium TaxID=2609290 RepID=UPI001604A841|nr:MULTISPECIES: HPr family phosphocarrier protein [unclassified Microbacterium]QNA93076.1 HPr family phosphocarrier protein [Microbacterium sp. Se63.02b]QYM63255.1 HPr family phosphocarrier protein [Microbacterium sp. Se5.02b]
MPTRHLIVSAHNGAHARPVAELVRLAQSHGTTVTLRTADGTTVDLSSVLAVMDLGIASGDAVVLETAPSDTSEAVLDQLAEVLAPRE